MASKIRPMDSKEIRRLNLLGVCSQTSREDVAARCGYPDTGYLNQLVNKKVSRTQIGDKTARKIEKGIGKEPGWLDVPHPEIWPEDEVMAAFKASDTEISIAYSLADPGRQEAVRALLGIAEQD